MSTPPTAGGRPDAVTIAVVLDALKATKDELAATKDEIANLRQYGHRNRLLIWAAVIGLILDITASVIAGYALVSLHHEQAKERHNAATISQLHELNVSACQTGNARLIKQQKALNAILTVGGPPRSAQAKLFIEKAEGFVASGWQARKCTKIYALPPGH